MTVQQYVQCIEIIEICSARIAEKHAQRRCCKNCDRRSPVLYCFHYTVALQATNKVIFVHPYTVIAHKDAAAHVVLERHPLVVVHAL